MNCCYEDYNSYSAPETYKNSDAPVPAGTLRFLFGLLMMFVGFYVGTFSEIPGHGLGFLMVLGSPFILLTDRK
jgi:hypothetical protein